jgi:large subunit ribosomal protein L17
MRHLKHRHQLGLKKEHRAAVIATLAASLLEHGRIRTTLAKAKALRPFVERIITLAKKAESVTAERAVAYRRLALARVRDKGAVARLFNDRVSEFKDRSGGYTRIYKLGPRIGDAAEMAVIELIEASDEGYRASRRRSRKKKGSAPPAADASEAPAAGASAAEDASEEDADAGSKQDDSVETVAVTPDSEDVADEAEPGENVTEEVASGEDVDSDGKGKKDS